MIFNFDKLRKDTGFRFVKGCWASCEKKIREGFDTTDTGFIANVSAEHIAPLFRDYIDAQSEELFLFIETPCNLADEEPNVDGIVDNPHVNVYYWDSITKEEANAVLDHYGDWLINDGFARFGFGISSFASEIMKDSYNVMTVYSRNPSADKPLLERHMLAIPALRTAWTYFDRQHPGECFRYEQNGKTVYDAVNELMKLGLYFAERRPIQ
ncbi:MAG: hypothetical protein IJ438_05370 [Clostridia bacterium]|nr:hypothetical protein [Clostridia bacterium]